MIKQYDSDTDDDFSRDDTETVTAVQAGRNCHAKGLHKAVCTITPSADARYLSIGMGDRDDRGDGGKHVRIDTSWHGREGDDRIRGVGANDYLTGGTGDDVLRGADSADTLKGGEGDDRLFGGAGRDNLTPGPGPGPGRDVARGGPQNDYVYSNDGPAHVRERFDGGQGVDTTSFNDRCRPVVATLGASGGTDGEHDRLRHFETLAVGAPPHRGHAHRRRPRARPPGPGAHLDRVRGVARAAAVTGL